MKKAILTLASAALFGCSTGDYTSVSINPEFPTTNDSLECSLDSNTTFDFYWTRNGEYYKENLNSNESYISNLETQVGDEWICGVYIPQNGFTDSYYVGQASVVVE